MSHILVTVGNRKYNATPEVLSKSPYFARLIETSEIGLAHTIDRDPQFFGPLLAYMRKGKMAVDPKDLDVADKVQLFQDILFFELEALYPLIEEDVRREGAKSADDIAAEFERLKVRDEPPKRKPAPNGHAAEKPEAKDVEGGDPAAAPVADPTVQPNGVGCFLCGTMDHDEKTCKFSPNNTAG